MVSTNRCMFCCEDYDDNNTGRGKGGKDFYHESVRCGKERWQQW